VSTPLKPADVEGDIPRPVSVLSSNTAEEEEAGNDLHPNDVDVVGPLVDTLFEWKLDGDHVYVTGTFAGWNRKYRLHRK